MARLCRFYGWSLDYVEGMDAEDFKMMLLAEDVISNRETLEKMRCADFPTINASERRNLHKEIHKKAFPNNKPKIVKFDDIERLFNG
jgi:hypothetical protein